MAGITQFDFFSWQGGASIAQPLLMQESAMPLPNLIRRLAHLARRHLPGQELRRMSDRELSDLGVGRSEIPHVLAACRPAGGGRPGPTDCRAGS